MKLNPTARRSFPLASAIAALVSTQSASAADGTWFGATGNWTDAGTWSGGTIADGTGFTANFTSADITADQTITLAADRTIGNIIFTVGRCFVERREENLLPPKIPIQFAGSRNIVGDLLEVSRKVSIVAGAVGVLSQTCTPRVKYSSGT